MISLYGKTARLFKKRYNYEPRNIPINVNSAGEAMRAMESQFPCFKELMRKGYYRVTRGEEALSGKDIHGREINVKYKDKSWHFMPMAQGCGGNSDLTIIAGVVLIAVGAIMMYTGWGTWAAPYVISLGVGLVFGGVAAMLYPAPKPGDSDNKGRPEERASYLFDGPVNTIQTGVTVPLVYGETWIGSIIASAALEIKDTEEAE